MKIYNVRIKNQPEFQVQAGLYQAAMQRARRIARDLFGLNSMSARLPIKISEVSEPTEAQVLCAEQMAHILGEPFEYSRDKSVPSWDRFCSDFNRVFEQESAL